MAPADTRPSTRRIAGPRRRRQIRPPLRRARILTLAEGLELARGRVNLYLDCKEVDPARLARDVIAARMEHQVVIYDTPSVIKAVRAAATAELALMTKWRPRFGITPWVDELRLAAVEIDAGDVTPAVCREFKSRGIKVQAKTLGADDRPEIWDRVVAAGVDWIQTDLAEEVIARQVLKKIRRKAGKDRLPSRRRQICTGKHRARGRKSPPAGCRFR